MSPILLFVTNFFIGLAQRFFLRQHMRFKGICEGSQTLIKPFFAIITYTDMFAYAHKTKIL